MTTNEWDSDTLRAAMERSAAVLDAARGRYRVSPEAVVYARRFRDTLKCIEADLMIRMIDLTVERLNNDREPGPPPGFFGEV